MTCAAVRVEQVDPTEFAPDASAILRDAWRGSGMSYSVEYLRWEFSFPGASSGVGVAAFDGTEAVGFIGATTRRVRFHSDPTHVWVVSFAAVRPQWQGRGIAARLYERLLDVLRPSTRPVVTFGDAGSRGEHVLLRAYAASGYAHSSLGTYPIHGAVPLPVEDGACLVRETIEPAALDAAVARCPGDDTLWNYPDADGVQHYLGDPRGRAAVLLQDAEGRPQGAAFLCLLEVDSGDAVRRVPTVDSLWLSREATVDTLRSLVRYTSERWREAGAGGPVTLPNVSGVDAGVLRAAGIRRTARCFQGHLFGSDNREPLLRATRTNLEIV